MKFYTNFSIHKDNVQVRGYDENNNVVLEEIPYQPTLFIPSTTKANYKSIYGKKLSSIKFESISAANEFRKNCNDVVEIHGMEKFEYACISDMFRGKINYDTSVIKVGNLDIETEITQDKIDPWGVPEKINALTITYDKGNTYYIYTVPSKEGETWKQNHDNIQNKQAKLIYNECYDEKELLLKFLDDYENECPDVLIGWNILFFDIPYIINRTKKLLGNKTAKRISPYRYFKESTIQTKYGEQRVYKIKGVSILDYLDLYKTFTYKNQESYSLDNIAHVELKERKLSYKEHKNLHELYQMNFQKFIDYNIKDVEIVQRLDDKLKLLEIVYGIAYEAKCNFEDTFKQVRTWDSICFNEIRDLGKVIPPNKKGTKDHKYDGAYVKEPTPNYYEWVCSYDLNSLYPNIMIQLNISPETVKRKVKSFDIDTLVKNNVDLGCYINENECIAPNGQIFDIKKVGFLPGILKRYYNERKHYKNLSVENYRLYEETKEEKYAVLAKIYNCIQMVRKIQLNSAYGAIGSEYFRYYNTNNAEAVTLMGQYVIKSAEKAINTNYNRLLKNQESNDYVIGIDTDSVYSCLKDLVNTYCKGKDKKYIVEFLDKFSSDVVEKWFTNEFDSIFKKLHGIENRMVMKREIIAESTVWIAKKRYIMKAWANEDVFYHDPYYKVMGMESQRSSTPELVRNKLKEFYKIVLENNAEQTRKFIKIFQNEFKKYDIEDIAFPRGVNNIEKYTDNNTLYKKGTPIHVRASILYNKQIVDNYLTKEYELITNGDKIKYIYLKLPNRIRENVIAFKGIFPRELNIHECIDYKKQFDKIFLEPATQMMNVMKWEMNPKRNILQLLKRKQKIK